MIKVSNIWRRLCQRKHRYKRQIFGLTVGDNCTHVTTLFRLQEHKGSPSRQLLAGIIEALGGHSLP